MDVGDKKERILEFLKKEGPSLPASIARVIGLDLFLTSAILSEMLSEKRVKASLMKVGSSPLYFLPGQEKDLERFVDRLGRVEQEAISLVRERILKDSEQEPRIRVALRSLGDFVEAFEKNGEIFWRYKFAEKSVSSEDEKGIEDKVEERQKEKSEEERNVEEGVEKEQIEDSEEEKKIEEGPDEQEKVEEPLKTKEENLERKENNDQKQIVDIFESKSDFLLEVEGFLKEKGLVLKEKIQSDKKEVVGVVGVESEIGEIDFLLIAKNKKSVSRDEVNSAIQRAVYQKMPCLLLIRKELPKTLKKFVENNNLIKIAIIGEQQ